MTRHELADELERFSEDWRKGKTCAGVERWLCLNLPTILSALRFKATRDQAVSFAYGNCKLSNPDVTREMVERAWDEKHLAETGPAPRDTTPGCEHDNPDFDATDFAHYAWWRGCDYGVAATVRVVRERAIDKGPSGGRFGSAELQRLCDDLWQRPRLTDEHRLKVIAEIRAVDTGNPSGWAAIGEYERRVKERMAQ